jgi:3-oxoacyl-[acyl-carrier-protein] synthase II
MRPPDRSIRLAVTGLGVVCAIGRNQHEVWSSILASRDGISSLSHFPGESFPTTLAAEVAGDPYEQAGVTRSAAKRMSRTDLLAIAAAREALAQAGGAESLPLDGMIVSSGTSTGGLLEGEGYFFTHRRSGVLRSPASAVLQQPTSGPSDAVASALGIGGGVVSNATACASAGAAIGVAADLIRSGQAVAALAGGSDALCRLTYSGFNVLQAVDPERCTPFGASRQGITLGEGAGYLVIERLDDALARGATILAEISGYGASCDAHHPTAPAEDGRGAAAAMRAALEDGRLTISEVDYINAHGTGTLLNDSAETRAIESISGGSIPVSSSKSFFGHTLGAAGGIEAVVTVLALMNGIAPPTLRLDQAADDCTLDYVPNTPRALAMSGALSNTFGFGGSNVSLLFRRYGGTIGD